MADPREDERVALLEKVPLFAGLGAIHLRRISAIGREVQSRNLTLISQANGGRVPRRAT